MSFESHRLVKPKLIKRAKSMRRDMTGPERKLWRAIRQRLAGPQHHFRRQILLGSYIVDFCCFSNRLIIELDGNQHGTEEAQRHDAARTKFLESNGFRVLRFANEDVTQDIESVLDTILAALPGFAAASQEFLVYG